uniref:Uncharacterized protein n=1 Tax=Magnetococcus massalia (strain MO-1) TaxID=451514 RepID=A0A1S7LKR5_MAGMO|nr:conserved exported protein of unknown function [<<include Tetratricopeptide repeat domain] [Candidatus Magnetococcus massalia]
MQKLIRGSGIPVIASLVGCTVAAQAPHGVQANGGVAPSLSQPQAPQKVIEMERAEASSVSAKTAQELAKKGDEPKEPRTYTPQERLSDLNASFHFLVGHMQLNSQDWKAAEQAFSQVVKHDDEALASQVMVARLAMRRGDFDKAVLAAQKVVEQAPDHKLARTMLAGILSALKRYPEAIEQYEALLKYHPDNHGTRLLLAQLYGRVGQAEKSQGALGELLDHPLMSWRSWLAVGRSWLHQKDKQRALEAFSRSHQAAPEQLETTLALGSVLQDLKKVQEAEKIYRAFLQDHPSNQVVHTRLGRLLLTVDDREGALKVFSSLQKLAPTSVQAHLSSAFILLGQERYSEALEALRLAEALQPENPSIRYYLGQTLEYLERLDASIAQYEMIPQGATYHPESRIRVAYLKLELGHKEDAVKICESLYKLFPKRVDVVLALNFLQLQTEQHQAVVKSANEGLRLDDTESRFIFNRAMAYDKLGMWKEAEADLQSYIKTNPNDAHALNYLGYTWADRNENLEKSLDLLRKAAELAPGDGFITDSLGWVLFRMNRLEESLNSMRKAVRLQPDDPTIAEHLGDVLKALNRKKEAAQIWQRALKLGADAKKLGKKLRSLGLNQ